MDSSKEVLFIGVLLLLAVVVGALFEAIGWALFIASCVWIGVQSREFRKVFKWAQRPLRRPKNGREHWFALAYPPFRALQRERQRTHDMNDRLREVLGLIEVIPDGVIILSPHGDIEGMNNAAKHLLQLSDTDIGLGLATVVRSPNFVAFVRSERKDEPIDFTSPFNAEQSFEARRFDVGSARTIVLIRDITELNRLLTMRQNFVANVSHELRTPLTVVAGYLETMLDVEQPQDVRLSVVGRLEKPVSRMQSLVDDLMLLTQLESTPVQQTRDRVQLDQVIHAVVSELAPLTTVPDQISVDIDTDATVVGIENELHSVCMNLIGNALRYSPPGKSVEVSLYRHKEAVRFKVKDQGYGIAPEHLDRLTERFYRVDLAGARVRGGTGLGLAIVKHVLLRHDTQLQIESQLGEGSSFYCDFTLFTEN